jgi:HEAT repeat protein
VSLVTENGDEIRRLEEALESPSEEARLAAIWALADKPGDVAVGLLLGALGDRSTTVRREAAWTLAGLSARELVVPALTEILSLGGGRSAAAATEALVTIGRAATLAVARVLAAGPTEGRRRAAMVLGDIGEPSSVPALAAALNDTDRRVRVAAADALASIASEEAAQALVRACDTVSDLGTRLACFDALARLHRVPSSEALTRAARHAASRRLALRLLASRAEPALLPLCLEALDDRAAPTREAALCALAAMPQSSLPQEGLERIREALGRDGWQPLRAGLASHDRMVRRAALTLAGWLGASNLAVEVARLLREPPLRERALAALESMGIEVRQVLLQASREAPPAERGAALEALSWLKATEVLPLCREALDDPHPIVAAAGARALGRQGGTPDLPLLLHAMERGSKLLLEAAKEGIEELARRDPGPARRILAGHAVGSKDEVDAAVCEVIRALSDEALLPTLRRVAREGGPHARESAAKALGDLGQAEDGALLVSLLEAERSAVRTAAIRALTRLCVRGLGPPPDLLRAVIERGLLGPESEVREAAVGALCCLDADEACARLIDLCASAEVRVATAAVAAVRKLGSSARLSDRLAALESAVRHDAPEVVRAAVAALGEIPDAAALPPACRLLAHPRFEVRIAAVRALSGRGPAIRPMLTQRLSVEDDPLVRDALRGALSQTALR